MKNKGFTLIEVLIASTIFIIIMSLVLVAVTGAFRSFNQAQVVLNKEQRQRLCLWRLSKEVASFARVVFPEVVFKGEQDSFFLSLPKRIAW